ncbi:MAG: transposase [Clostridiales bacterium GWF2_38_85]|nr:MAG: transposase [Clostridiales bacterium GWF2_38_85]HBL85322.1 transposase [Clostridiales bacterium]
MIYDKAFREEAIKLSDEIGLKKASQQLGVPYYTLSDWRKKFKNYDGQIHVGSGHARLKDPQKQREMELEKENAELRRANEILQEAMVFFVKGRKK